VLAAVVVALKVTQQALAVTAAEAMLVQLEVEMLYLD
jgi:hypothetical protein